MIPIATTTITVKRSAVDAAADPYDAPAAPAVVATGVRAHISAPAGTETVAGTAAQEVVRFRLDCDPVDVNNRDTVVDDVTGDVYEVVWARARHGLGLDHVEAELLEVTGVVA